MVWSQPVAVEDRLAMENGARDAAHPEIVTNEGVVLDQEAVCELGDAASRARRKGRGAVCRRHLGESQLDGYLPSYGGRGDRYLGRRSFGMAGAVEVSSTAFFDISYRRKVQLAA